MWMPSIVDGLDDDPGPVRLRVPWACRGAVESLAAAAVHEQRAGLRVGAAAASRQVEDYWWEGVIPSVHYSPGGPGLVGPVCPVRARDEVGSAKPGLTCTTPNLMYWPSGQGLEPVDGVAVLPAGADVLPWHRLRLCHAVLYSHPRILVRGHLV